MRDVSCAHHPEDKCYRGPAQMERRTLLYKNEIDFPLLDSPRFTMSSTNGLVCFTNCLLPLEDGSLVEKDLWFDENRGIILDAQVYYLISCSFCF